MSIPSWRRPLLAAAVALLCCTTVQAQEALIRKTLAERLPQLPAIDEVTRTPVPGLWEVRFGGSELLYSDDKGDFILVNGSMLETRTRTDLTEARINQLTAVDFDKLPVKDAITIRQGSGKRRLAVFVDPNCGYCKRFERDLAGIKDLTLHVFLIPILGPDSATKSRDIWCAKDAPRAWRGWMIDGVIPPKAGAGCDTGALDRNLAFSRSTRINGTPAVFFEDGTRKPGALPAEAVEKLLASAAAARR